MPRTNRQRQSSPSLDIKKSLGLANLLAFIIVPMRGSDIFVGPSLVAIPKVIGVVFLANLAQKQTEDYLARRDKRLITFPSGE